MCKILLWSHSRDLDKTKLDWNLIIFHDGKKIINEMVPVSDYT